MVNYLDDACKSKLFGGEWSNIKSIHQLKKRYKLQAFSICIIIIIKLIIILIMNALRS